MRELVRFCNMPPFEIIIMGMMIDYRDGRDMDTFLGILYNF